MVSAAERSSFTQVTEPDTMCAVRVAPMRGALAQISTQDR